MSVKIESVGAKYSSVKLRLTTSRGHRFFMVVDESGISFYSDESSSGAVGGKPIRKSADDLLDWFGGEGDNKPFRLREQVKPKKPPATSKGSLPKFLFPKK